MPDWERFKHDLRSGVTTVGGRLVRVAHQAGRELAVMEARLELARIERELAKLHQELGEAAHEGWRQTGVFSLHSSDMHVRLDAIVALTARRDAVKRDLAPDDAVDLPLSEQ